jgi:GNAT superfamily N-acetyltransferase
MLEVTRNVWQGNDYVPFVWERWLADGSGHLTVAVRERTVCGLMHVEIQSDGTAWAEGIRVREELQSKGIGRALLNEGISWARRAGSRRMRLSTYGGNPASNRLAVKSGLLELARMKVLAVEPNGFTHLDGCRLALPADLDDVWGTVSGECGGHRGPVLYTEGWTAYTLDRRRLALLLADHSVLVSNAGPRKGIAIATSRPGRPVLRLGYLNGNHESTVQLVRALLTRAASAHITRVSAVLNLEPEAGEILESVGFRNPDAGEMIVYELGLEA